jgi:cytoskeleton protein RodZ
MTPSLKSESTSESTIVQPLAASSTAGQLLREARLKAGVHLAVLSVTLKVPVRQLEALEADELDSNKGPVFYRGLASSMCRHLGADPAPIMALLPQPSAYLKTLQAPVHVSVPAQSLLSDGGSSDPRRVSPWVVWGAGLMVLLTLALLWMPVPSQWTWFDDIKTALSLEGSSQESDQTVSALPPVLSAPSVPAPAASEPASSPAALVDVASPVTLTQASEPSTPKVPASVRSEAPNNSSSKSAEWVFTATGDSWLEVRNAQSAVVWIGVIKAGETIRTQSPLPVSVVVGRAQMVTATLRGQPFDLKPHTQVTVARFEVKE